MAGNPRLVPAESTAAQPMKALKNTEAELCKQRSQGSSAAVRAGCYSIRAPCSTNQLRASHKWHLRALSAFFCSFKSKARRWPCGREVHSLPGGWERAGQQLDAVFHLHWLSWKELLFSTVGSVDGGFFLFVSG